MIKFIFLRLSTCESFLHCLQFEWAHLVTVCPTYPSLRLLGCAKTAPQHVNRWLPWMHIIRAAQHPQCRLTVWQSRRLLRHTSINHIYNPVFSCTCSALLFHKGQNSMKSHQFSQCSYKQLLLVLKLGQGQLKNIQSWDCQTMGHVEPTIRSCK